MTTHIMVDLETLGTVPGCVGLSIGAVVFYPETGKLGPDFYSVISVDDSTERFLSICPDTQAWWARQSAEARQVLDEAYADTAPGLEPVMAEFNKWLQSMDHRPTKIRIWGNGADFDNPILRCMYDATDVKPYAGAYGGRCYRTLKSLDELFGAALAFGKLQRSGAHHNALDDARSQALHLMENIARIRNAIAS